MKRAMNAAVYAQGDLLASSIPLVFVRKVMQLSTKVMHSQIEKINV